MARTYERGTAVLNVRYGWRCRNCSHHPLVITTSKFLEFIISWTIHITCWRVWGYPILAHRTRNWPVLPPPQFSGTLLCKLFNFTTHMIMQGGTRNPKHLSSSANTCTFFYRSKCLVQSFLCPESISFWSAWHTGNSKWWMHNFCFWFINSLF